MVMRVRVSFIVGFTVGWAGVEPSALGLEEIFSGVTMRDQLERVAGLSQALNKRKKINKIISRILILEQ
jgi:hypothetical protein